MNNPLRPELPDETVVFTEGDKVLFLIPSKPDWVIVNKNTALALALCNGNNTINDIKEKLSIHINHVEAVSIIEKLYNDGFLIPKYLPKGKTCRKNILRSVHLNIENV